MDEDRAVYADETSTMDNVNSHHPASEFSMRRTLYVLLGAVAAFAVLTASYATADLPAGSADMVKSGVVSIVE